MDPPDFVLAAMAAVDDAAEPQSRDEPRRDWDPWRRLRDWPSATSVPAPVPTSVPVTILRGTHLRPRVNPPGAEVGRARHVLRRRR